MSTTARDAFPDFSPADHELVAAVAPYTMTSPERIFALARAVEHVSRAGIDGDVVECGVWRGGSMMAAATVLRGLGDTSRTLWLYDTYEGMSAPTAEDVSHHGEDARAALAGRRRDEHDLYWAWSPLEAVRANLRRTGYPEARCRFVQGRVEDTIPAAVPERIALLRLDTDWYESTRHELEHLYPRLVPGGVLVVDDYGHWRGSRKAVDEYLARLDLPPLLHRVDYTGRVAVKPGAVAARPRAAALPVVAPAPAPAPAPTPVPAPAAAPRGLTLSLLPAATDAAAAAAPASAPDAALPPVELGHRTYHGDNFRAVTWVPGERVVVGRYCSIAADVTICAGGGHRTDAVSTFPLEGMLLGMPNPSRAYRTTPNTEIGSDVWIGHGAHVLGGVTVGHGAVIAARAVVFSDVPPYAIVAGNPARVVRYRFSRPTVERLLRVAWWDWPESLVRERLDWFYRPLPEFLAAFDPDGESAAPADGGADAHATLATADEHAA